MNSVQHLWDPGTFEPVHDGLESRDPLSYPGYREALGRARDAAGSDESVVYGTATVGGHACFVAAFRFSFMGGSMGEVAGERVARAAEEAARRRVPLVLSTETGGARMQEGMRSLVQMPKVVAARIELAGAHVPFIVVLGAPTTGGVLASIGALADVTFAVEGATVGFAGPRVAQRVTGRPLSPDSHTARRALERGLVDAVVPGHEIGTAVARALAVVAPDRAERADAPAAPTGARPDAWAAVEGVRDPSRPRGPELVHGMTNERIVLHGDRAGGVDPAVTATLARVGGRRCVIVALDARKAPGPAAYRTARRAMAVAERLDIPLVTLVDTRGADPGEGSEADGIAWEIASTFEAMLTLGVASLSVVTGEGGSGGALAFATADRLVAYEDAVFSVIAPEGAAEILWRDAARAPEAAAQLRLTAPDLVDLRIVDALVGAPLTPASLRTAVAYHLHDLEAAPGLRAAERRRRWRRRGEP